MANLHAKFEVSSFYSSRDMERILLLNLAGRLDSWGPNDKNAKGVVKG